jgi:CubicO group peptidase (beta-lactamase class C family)
MMKKIKHLFKPVLIVLFLIIPISCTKDNSTQPSPPPASTYDSQKLNDAFTLAGTFSGLKCLVVSQNGIILKEAYFGSGGADVPHDVRSVTKTVTSLLVGIAIREGYVHSVDETLGEISTAVPSDKTVIKVKDLLTMSGGFSWNELSQVSEYINWFNSPNQVNYVLSRSLVAQPGHNFTYNSAALHLLSVGITLTSNMSTLAFVNKYLFNDLGIAVNYWEQDHQGIYNGAAGLNITPHAMVKIGNLILNRGVYNGKQIVPSGWIDQMVQTQISTNNAQPYGPGYGYGIWTGQNTYGNYAWANGFGGQFIVIVPSRKLVVVATNEWSSVSSDIANSRWSNTINLIMSNVLNAFN